MKEKKDQYNPVVKVTGNNDLVSHGETKKIVKLFSRLLMSNRLCQKLNITVRFVKNIDIMGETEVVEEGLRLPRTFEIFVRNTEPKIKQIKTLAHEMVHVKQYARGELKNAYGHYMVGRGAKAMRINGHGFRWNKKFYHNNEADYFTTPWEIEAYGREFGLYQIYLDSRKYFENGNLKSSKR